MKIFLKMVISIGLLALAIRMLDVEFMIRTLQQGSPAVFAIAISVNILTFIVMGIRWYRLVSAKQVTTFGYQMSIYFKATFFNTFTPANLGGDAYRLMALRGALVTTGGLVKLLLLERILGLYGYVIIFVIAYALIVMFGTGGGVSIENPYLYGLAVAAMVFALPFLARPLGAWLTAGACKIIGKERLPKLGEWVDTLAALLSPKGTLWPMVLTFVGILLWVKSIQVVASGFGLDVPALHLAAVATLVELVRLVPVTVQGIGLREGVFAYLLSFFGYNLEQCYVVGLAAYLALSVAIVLCGPIGQAMAWSSKRRVAQ